MLIKKLNIRAFMIFRGNKFFFTDLDTKTKDKILDKSKNNINKSLNYNKINKEQFEIPKSNNLDMKDIEIKLEEEEDEEEKILKSELSKKKEKKTEFKKKQLSGYQHLLVIMNLLKNSFKELYKDSKFLLKLNIDNKIYGKELDLLNEYEKKRITIDLLKFIPYSFFVLIPIAELLLPLYIVLFPNSTPSQFLFESKLGKILENKVKLKEEGFLILKNKVLRNFNEFGTKWLKLIDLIENKDDIDDKDLINEINDIDNEIEKILSVDGSKDKFSLYNLNNDELEAVCKFFFIDYIPGNNILNKVWYFTLGSPFLLINFGSRLFKKKNYFDVKNNKYINKNFKLNFFPLKQARKLFWISQINSHFKKVRNLDKKLCLNDNIPIIKLNDIARSRGFEINDTKIINNLLFEVWKPISTNKSISNEQLIFTSILKHLYVEKLYLLKYKIN